MATILGDGNRPRRFAPLFGKWNPKSHHSETSRDVQTHETWINTRHGRLFAKIWGENKIGSRVKAPIVLLHDSLGCVEIWRNLPAHLSQATGHAVIAYDRLGFGRSDPHPERIGALAAGPATIEILPDCGHIPYREKEKDLIAMIGTFLRQTGSERRDAFS